ncbi:MAG: 3-hydroxyacyl-CoA dehydrogenase/enoyl-CoA hydratase family protein, partial [Pseudomonadota bacterium]|nr:3-hydroxyacyl-CoA dehydrogenase/enoyl-CoA hydratase family protein [Pseudomonadota bacterium]
MKIANIKVAAVLGSGTMGAQLAACLANSGIKAYLYDLKDGDKLIAATAKTNLRKINPQPLQTAATSELVKACSYDEDLNLLQECDLIIEAVAENIDIKKSIFTKISPFIKSGTWIGTNTSGLSVNKISLSLPEELRSRFLGTHFFNPPRYLPLVEIIRTIHTQADIEPLINFIISILGKEVVLAPDSPNFIANRVGLFSLLLTTRNAIKFQIPFEVVDTLTGIPLARPKSATFRTADVVGLDILANAIKTSASVSHDPWHDINSIPSFMQKLIDNSSLGQKSGKGIYEKRKDGIYVLDLDTMAYRIATKKPPSSLLKLLAREDKYEVLNTLCKSKEKHHQFLWLTIAELLHYCSWLCEDLAITTADLDNAIKLGFGWELGPFELWQQADVRKTAMLLESNINSGKHNVNIPLPNFVNLYNLFYKGNTSLAPRQGKFVAPTEFAASSRSSLRKILTTRSFEQKIIFETNETKLWTDKDEVFIFSIKTKLATINSKVLNDFMKAIETAEANNIPLVIWHEHEKNFGAGANLKDIGKQYMLGGGKAIGKVIAQFQNTVMRLKYANIPTIAAVQGLCLGGSCEIMLHCKHRVVTFNSYIGLVEAGV